MSRSAWIEVVRSRASLLRGTPWSNRKRTGDQRWTGLAWRRTGSTGAGRISWLKSYTTGYTLLSVKMTTQAKQGQITQFGLPMFTCERLGDSRLLLPTTKANKLRFVASQQASRASETIGDSHREEHQRRPSALKELVSRSTVKVVPSPSRSSELERHPNGV